MSGLLEILVAAIPFAVIGALLSLTSRARERRARGIERQIALTDAIHRELGAAAAPEVILGPRGWIVRMAVPLHHPALVASLARITHDLFARLDRPEAPPLELVLDHRDAGPRRARAAAGSAAAGLEPAGARRLHAA